MSTSYVLSDGANVVSLNPDYDLRVEDKRIESSHRTRDGSNYRYLWGMFRKVKFGVEGLSSADMTQINSWWSGNAPLRLFDPASTVVISGYITSAAEPIGEYYAPYYTQFKGIIELESY